MGVGTVMTANTGHRIEIADSAAHVRVEVDGVTVAETRSARVLRETGLPPRWYLPLADVDPDVLAASDFASHCPFKGEASYYDVEVAGARRSNLIWSYAEPFPGAAAIAGMLSFVNGNRNLTRLRQVGFYSTSQQRRRFGR